jgi:hypothetical protein
MRLPRTGDPSSSIQNHRVVNELHPIDPTSILLKRSLPLLVVVKVEIVALVQSSDASFVSVAGAGVVPAPGGELTPSTGAGAPVAPVAPAEPVAPAGPCWFHSSFVSFLAQFVTVQSKLVMADRGSTARHLDD